MSELASSEPRAKRQKVDKTGRLSALQKLRQLKGTKNKYEVEEEVDNVYDIVDEKEYAKKARERYGDDWIEGDDTGYAEDGRDFFEDEDEYSSEEEDARGASKKDKKGGKKRPRDDEKQVKGKRSIMNLFRNAVPKKTVPATIADDDVLADILGELDGTKPSQNSGKPKKTEANVAKDYMNTFMKEMKQTLTKKKTEEPRSTITSKENEELLQRVMKPKQLEGNTFKDIKPIVESRRNEKPEKSETIPAVKESDLSEASKKKESLESIMNDDLDFDCLHDVENQFEIEKVKPKEPEIPKVVEKKAPAKQTTQQENAEDLQSLLSNWESICQDDNFEEEAMNSSAVTSNNENEMVKENLKFWYWEASEEANKRPGEIFLFGRTADGKSIAVRVQNIERVLYLLPREYLLDPISKEPTKEKVTYEHVCTEFNKDIFTALKLDGCRSRKVTKNFANHSIGFDVPQVCDYVEVRYDGRKSIPDLKKKYNSIAYIFGGHTTPLERFILDRKIKGPCWLNLKQFTKNLSQLSWCKMDVNVANPKDVMLVEDTKPPPPPPLTLLTLNVRTVLNPKTLKNEVCMISMLVHNRFQIDMPAPKPIFNRHMCGFTRTAVRIFPLDLKPKLASFKATRVYKHDSERSLLSWFLAQYQQIDADLIVTFDKDDCQLNVLSDRITQQKLPQWSRLGRLRLSDHFNKRTMEFFVGRMVCDVRHSAVECIRSRSYDLQTLCQNVLKLNENDRMDLNEEDINELYETGDGVIKLITLTMQDASYILRLMYELNIMPLALQMTNICGTIMNRTLQKGRNDRNEFLLLHAFTEKNYIVPDKKKREWHNETEQKSLIINADETTGGPAAATTGRKKAAYAGGMVLDPIRGLYDKYILLMDFNSLYPSIIQEYNICFTTVQLPYNQDDLPALPDATAEPGILPQQLRRLVESRRQVKKLMAAPDLTPEQYMQYHIRQMALKLTANSMYGCLGFGQSRFYAQHLAALVTHKGREILMNTKSLVEKMNYVVVYGDTDSIMVNTNITDYDQVFKIGSTIKQTVNKMYKQLELDIDGVFSCLLLLKKKKYAAVKVSKNAKGELKKEQEHKGLDIVRRDWSQVAVMIGKVILDEILSEKPLDEKLDAVHAYLEKIKTSILDGEVPTAMFIITKQLSKAPTEFSNTSTQPHVQVALRMNSTRNRRYKKGDMVDYVICDDGTKNPATQRAYHLDELKTNESLKLDTNYYLAHQIHPVVTRMLDVLEGTDASRIAECLGLDPSKFKAAAQRTHQERSEDVNAGEAIAKTTLQKYRLCEKFKFLCITCKTENIIASAFRPTSSAAQGGAGHEPVLQKCSNPDCTTPPYTFVVSIRNQLMLNMRKYTMRFYQNWLVCDDPACNQNTRYYTHVTANNRPVCPYCKNGSLVRQYTESDLYRQLSYFQYIFDLSKHQHKNIVMQPEAEAAYQVLKETVDQQLKKSAYWTIGLAKLFARLKPIEKSDEISLKPIEIPHTTIATTLEE